MPIDPRRYAMTPEGRTAERLADLERRAGRTDAYSLNRVTVLARIGRVTNYVASAASVTFPFTDMDFDTSGAWNASTPDRLTIPSSGVYLIGATVTWNTTGTGVRISNIRNNGVSGPGADNRTGDATAITKASPSVIMPCVAGDEITLTVQHGEAGTVTMQGTFTTLSIAYLGQLPTS